MNTIRLNEYKSKVIKALDDLNLDSIIEAARMIASCEGIVWTFGNGQGLSVAEAFALDLVKHGKAKATCLNSPAMLTAYANDYDFKNANELLVNDLFSKGDMCVGFSFHGSRNITSAIKANHRLGNFSILVTSDFGEEYFRPDYLIEDRCMIMSSCSDDIQVVEDVWSSICHMIANLVRDHKLKSSAQPEGD